MNVRSLKNHFEDIQVDNFLLKSDILALSETWFPVQDFHAPELQGYHGHHIMSGQGKGVSLFIRETFTLVSSPIKIDLNYLQILKAELPNFTLILVYRSPSRNSHSELADQLLKLIPNEDPVIILGDFNLHPKESNNHYSSFINRMATSGFTQIIDKPTHKEGNILDHVYVRSIDIANWQFHHPYYSDHDAICLRVNW